ncbi:hypothetical protein E4O98_12185 [Pseudomonas sp. W2Jun17]|nr:hypothetical protein [Pseudomonas sp. W2Jun17]
MVCKGPASHLSLNCRTKILAAWHLLEIARTTVDRSIEGMKALKAKPQNVGGGLLPMGPSQWRYLLLTLRYRGAPPTLNTFHIRIRQR